MRRNTVLAILLLLAAIALAGGISVANMYGKLVH
jgi:hypothetical protein